ncbi:MAG: hypothetical protein IT378_11045 [Sandaracinaceae bacterium]|nr:hypothetical protein [Sandaracinaceae bacterium]
MVHARASTGRRSSNGPEPAASHGALGAALVVLAAAWLPARAHAANVFLVWDPPTYAACHGTTEDMFACILGATEFNDVLAGYPGGLRVTVVGSYALPAECHAAGTVPGCLSASSTAVRNMFTCIQSALSLDLHDGDVIMYFTNVGACSGGYACNAPGMRLTAPSGAVTVRVGWSRVGNECRCVHAVGLHEVMEAATVGISDDCCNGQTLRGLAPSCSALFGPTSSTPYGVTSVRCGPGTYRLPGITEGPRADGLYYGEDCRPVQVTASAGSVEEVCTLARAERTAGRCVGGELVTCELGLRTERCEGACVSDPMPHCESFGATCTVDAPATMCSGGSAEVTVSCTNTGSLPFGAGLSLSVASTGAAGLFADPSWPSPAVAATVSPPEVPVGGTGTFRFALRAPVVLASVPYTLRFALGEAGGATYPSPSVSFDLDVTGCAPLDAGAEGGDASLADAARDRVLVAQGCACRAAPAGARPGALFLLFSIGALAYRRRRARKTE